MLNNVLNTTKQVIKHLQLQSTQQLKGASGLVRRVELRREGINLVGYSKGVATFL